MENLGLSGGGITMIGGGGGYPPSYTKEEIHKLCIEEASKSTAKKRKVGALLCTLDTYYNKYKIVGKGHNYNTNKDIPECEDIEGNTYDSVIHAEAACIANWLEYFNFNSSTVYYMFITHDPCPGCLASINKYEIKYEVVGEFMKFDKTKLRMSLVPASLGQACARALQYGAKKYKVGNWRKTPDIESYISAMQRHLDAWREGEDFDSESGLNHLDHMAANLAFLIELKHLPKIKDEYIKI